MAFDVYPMTRYSAVSGMKTVKDSEEAKRVFVPEHDWWPTKEEADAHRTDREAMIVVHNSRRVQADQFAAVHDPNADVGTANQSLGMIPKGVEGTDSVVQGGTVFQSVQFHENQLKPMIAAAAVTDEQRAADAKAVTEAKQSAIDAQAKSATAKVTAVPPAHTEISGA